MFKRSTAHPAVIGSLESLPDFGFQFFFRNSRQFLRPFLLLTIVSAASAVLSFLGVYLLGKIVSDLSTISISELLRWFLPIYVVITLLRESFDYLTRRYGEAFALFYCDWISIGFYRQLLAAPAATLFNISRERVPVLVAKYISNVDQFLNDWFWGASRRLTAFVIVLGILAFQDPLILVINLVYILLFLTLSFGISRRFAPIARQFAQQSIETSSMLGNFTLNLATLKRLGALDFFVGTAQAAVSAKWRVFEDVRKFHAQRWLIQLNLFNALYIGTLFFGAYQVKQGLLPLGYLLLIKYAFDRLWEILVYAIEYYVALVQQREDSRKIRSELKLLAKEAATSGYTQLPSDWKKIELHNCSLQFPHKDGSAEILIQVPAFYIQRGEKVGIIGPSGGGKTSLLLLLLRLLPCNGTYKVDEKIVNGGMLSPDFGALIANNDPLFTLPLLDSIVMGRDVEDARLSQVLNGLLISQFVTNLNQRLGEPTFNLSAGQEQRIRLARGVIGNASLYLLDEPFNGIDAASKKIIIEFLRQDLAEDAVVVVSHHAEELAWMDRLYRYEGHTLVPVS